MRSFSECVLPSRSSQVPVWNPKLSTTSVSPSQRPTEYPIHDTFGSGSSARPSIQIWRYVRSGLSMTMSCGVWTMRTISEPVESPEVAYAGPSGRQRICMPSFPRSSRRASTTARAHGWISSGFRSAAMLRAYFGENFVHRPERSGLPSGVRGAGAVRFGLPSAVRGMPAVGCFSHCAASGAPSAIVTTATTTIFMAVPHGNRAA